MPAILQIELPTETFVQLEQVARQQQRSVDELVREMILHELPSLPLLPEDLEAELEAFEHLSDDVLWLLAQSTLAVPQQEELANLNEIGQQRDLTVAEQQHQQSLLNAYERAVIRRAQAAALLKVRGHSVSRLTNPQAQ
jgi:hypothetical protein